jgi:hypothetical protein
MSATCDGLAADHCCYLGAAGVCRYLEHDTVPGRRWACGLRRELGSWEPVHSDPRYIAHVRPFWDDYASALDCGLWPPPGETCGTCGVIGDG